MGMSNSHSRGILISFSLGDWKTVASFCLIWSFMVTTWYFVPVNLSISVEMVAFLKTLSVLQASWEIEEEDCIYILVTF